MGHKIMVCPRCVGKGTLERVKTNGRRCYACNRGRTGDIPGYLTPNSLARNIAYFNSLVTEPPETMTHPAYMPQAAARMCMLTTQPKLKWKWESEETFTVKKGVQRLISKKQAIKLVKQILLSFNLLD